MDRVSLGISGLLLVTGTFALVDSYLQLTGISLGLVATNLGAFSFLALQGALLFIGGLAIAVIAVTTTPGESSPHESDA